MKNKPVLLAVSAAVFAAASTAPITTWAQATPKAKIDAEDSTVIILDDRIVLKRVPVTFGNALNKTILRDVTIQLGAKLADGKINSVKIVSETKATPLAVGFVAGRYKNFEDGCEFVVEGGSPGTGGRTNWSLSTIKKCNNRSQSATWQTGPISGHRDDAALVAAKCSVDGPAQAYGRTGTGAYYFNDSQLLRATHTNNGLVIEQLRGDNCGVAFGPFSLNLCPGGICPETE